MIPRAIEPPLRRLAAQFPVITITGPRQSGKTTLARNYFKEFDYVNLEEPETRAYAQEDPKGFLGDHPAPLIIDEVQRVPELLSYIQVCSDEAGRMGQYVLTGSHQPKLKAEVSQSLAGRTAILQLLPLSIAELSEAGISMDRDAYIHRGFLPKLHARPDADPELEYSNYFATYVERDVRQLIHLQHQHEFEVFVRLLAGRTGQLLNLSSLSDDVGISATTLNEWLNVLEASFIIFRLQPYFENFGKRLIKSPKIYFTEVGLASWLLGIKSSDIPAALAQFDNHPFDVVAPVAPRHRPDFIQLKRPFAAVPKILEAADPPRRRRHCHRDVLFHGAAQHKSLIIIRMIAENFESAGSS